MRLLKVDPLGVPLPVAPTQPELEEEENVRKSTNIVHLA